jgi:hypothetical protein
MVCAGTLPPNERCGKCFSGAPSQAQKFAREAHNSAVVPNRIRLWNFRMLLGHVFYRSRTFSRPVVQDGGSLAGNESCKVLSIISSDSEFCRDSFKRPLDLEDRRLLDDSWRVRRRGPLLFDVLDFAIGSLQRA